MSPPHLRSRLRIGMGLRFVTQTRPDELRQRKPLSLADAIIAATALTYDLTLFTENTKDYAGINGLKVLSIKDVLDV